jgi:hypothetical protein
MWVLQQHIHEDHTTDSHGALVSIQEHVSGGVNLQGEAFHQLENNTAGTSTGVTQCIRRSGVLQ